MPEQLKNLSVWCGSCERYHFLINLRKKQRIEEPGKIETRYYCAYDLVRPLIIDFRRNEVVE